MPRKPDYSTEGVIDRLNRAYYDLMGDDERALLILAGRCPYCGNQLNDPNPYHKSNMLRHAYWCSTGDAMPNDRF